MIANEADARSFVAGLCDANAMACLDRFIELLVDENGRQNLIARASVESIWQRHIADSAQLLAHVSRETPVWLDLGTGAGFPGLVIAIMRPQWPTFLVESRTRRIAWLARAHRDLAPNVRLFGGPLENLETFSVDVISARAFAPLRKTINLARRFSTNATEWILPKGASAAQERETLPAALRKGFHVEPSVTSVDAGILVGRVKE